MTHASVQGLAEALRSAGFSGVEIAGPDQLFARAHGPDGPEFQAEVTPLGWRFGLTHPVRAPQDALERRTTLHPQAPASLHQGEARLVMDLPALPEAELLPRWQTLSKAFVRQALGWRRSRRLDGEGM